MPVQAEGARTHFPVSSTPEDISGDGSIKLSGSSLDPRQGCSTQDGEQSSHPQSAITSAPLTVGNLARHTRATDVGTGGKDWAGKWLTGSSRAAASLRGRIARKEIVKPGTGKYDEHPAIPNMSAVSWGPAPSFLDHPVSRTPPSKKAALFEVKEPTHQQDYPAESEGVQLSPGASNLSRSEHSDGFTRPNNSRSRENVAEQDRSAELANNARMALSKFLFLCNQKDFGGNDLPKSSKEWSLET
ncbi:MAG: hypothetical protein Q9228_001315 [Teloschistes exilis]